MTNVGLAVHLSIYRLFKRGNVNLTVEIDAVVHSIDNQSMASRTNHFILYESRLLQSFN